MQRCDRRTPGCHRADSADVQMDRRRGMRRRYCHPAVEAHPRMTESRSALHIVEGIDLSDKTCVITGASSGLGRESARALAAAGATVILAARNTDALTDAARWIRAEVPDAKTATVKLDLTSLASVRTAGAKIGAAAPV